MAKSEYLECGMIQNTHGTRGVLRVQAWCDSPRVLAGLKTVYMMREGVMTPMRVETASVSGALVLLKLQGVDDMDAAEMLKNMTIYAARADLPLRDGEYFIADVPGLPVLDADNGKEYGRVMEVRDIGGRNYLVVETPQGERLYPMVTPLLSHVDVEAAVYVRPIPGLLEDA
jgi:16S rRNA processing protein RimM